jgi:hypothetical protein
MKDEQQVEESMKILMFIGAMMVIMITIATLRYII